MGFPTGPGDGAEYTTILGTVYKYRLSDDCWYIINDFGEIDNISDVVITGTPADNEGLFYDTGTSKWINQTAGEAGLALASQLHAQSHDNTYHTTNYHTESDGIGVVTIHSDMTSAGSGAIITTGERNALHTIYSLEQHNNAFHSTNYEVANANIQSHVASPPTSAHHVKTSTSDIQAVSINNLSEDASPQLGADLDLNGKTINCNGNLGSDHTFEGLVIDNITNAQAFGKFVYIISAHTTALCDKDSVVLSIGVSVGTGEVLYSGTIRDDSWAAMITIGARVYIGDDGNPTDDISGYATGDMVQCIGVAIDTNLILIKDICWVEIV